MIFPVNRCPTRRFTLSRDRVGSGKGIAEYRDAGNRELVTAPVSPSPDHVNMQHQTIDALRPPGTSKSGVPKESSVQPVQVLTSIHLEGASEKATTLHSIIPKPPLV